MSTFSSVRTGAVTTAQPRAAAWTLALLCAAQFLLVLDITVVNVAVPSLRAGLGLSASDAQWAVTAYAVPFGALLLAGARAGDRFGRRNVLQIGLVLFAVGSGVAAASAGAAGLVAGRVVQGVGAAAVSPSALALLVTAFPSGPAHRKALAAWGSVGAGGAAAGVVAGGVLTSWLGWRSIFWIGVPAAAAIAVAAGRLLPASPGQSARRLDAPSTALAAAATGAALLAASRGDSAGWASTGVLMCASTAAVCGALLLGRLRRAPDPLVRPELLRRRNVALGTGLMAAAAGSVVTAFYLTSLLLQEGHGHSAVRTGAEFLPAALLTAVAAHHAGRAIARHGTRAVGTVCLAVAAAGAVVLAAAGSAAPWHTGAVPGLLLLSAGLGGTFVVAGTTTMARFRPPEAGTLAGLSTTAHELGAGFVLAGVVAVSSAGALDPARLGSAYAAVAAVCGSAALVCLLALSPDDGRGQTASFVH